MVAPIPLQSLDRNIKIVNDDGTPTDFFMEFLQKRGVGQTDNATVLTELETDVTSLEGRSINTVAPITGGGNLTADRTIGHATSGVSPGTYGDSSHVSQITIDADGHVTVATQVEIRLNGYTVATLPTAGVIGRIAYVTDASAPTFLGVLTGGGTTKTPVFDNGTAWVSF